MPEDSSEKNQGIIGRIKGGFSSRFGKRSSIEAELRQITDRYKEPPKGINDLIQREASMFSEVTGVAYKGMFEILVGLSREAAEVTLEGMIEYAQADYDRAQKSGKDKERRISEVNVRTAAATQRLFDENRDQFPSIAAYIKDLEPEERAREILMLESQVKKARERFERTKKRDDQKEYRLSSKILESARSFVATEEEPL